jgi:hypothetical protein
LRLSMQYQLEDHKVPPAYSRAEESARSLTAVGMTTT